MMELRWQTGLKGCQENKIDILAIEGNCGYSYVSFDEPGFYAEHLDRDSDCALHYIFL